MMTNLITPTVLGIVEGLTEFLPVSSTGHLILTTEVMKFNQEAYASFNVIIQVAAILAVVIVYRQRLLALFKEPLKTSGFNNFHIVIAIMPALIIGFFSRHFIHDHLFNPHVVIASLFFGGIIMLIVEKFKPKVPMVIELNQLSYKNAFYIGLSQVLALIPGVSRSGSTIVCSLALGVDLKTSADFSFLISIPVITLACGYEFLKSYQTFKQGEMALLGFGMAVTFVVAFLAIVGFLSALKKIGLYPFAIYRIVIASIFFFVLMK